ncbi:hypothetical protein M0812_04551 [Anaeramoeba flamelloides]|uniref:Uncharacterized protein n=1 Tax=Anaeramoeba flamelloides TaxID=1746091 RepID=A0AAV8AEP9_9EUKA|nr:hypothetical protein M0812_04551 [Anaeramoeba flamelloides]
MLLQMNKQEKKKETTQLGISLLSLKRSPFLSKFSISQLKQKYTKDHTLKLVLLGSFLNKRPRPKWKERLNMFYIYDQKLILNWTYVITLPNTKTNNKTNNTKKSINKNPNKIYKHKVIIQKKLFKIYVSLTKGFDEINQRSDFLKCFRNSQKGVIEFMRTIGFYYQSCQDRGSLIFLI